MSQANRRTYIYTPKKMLLFPEYNFLDIYWNSLGCLILCQIIARLHLGYCYFYIHPKKSKTEFM